MLVQAPSKIFKNDFRIWQENEKNTVTEILNDKDRTYTLYNVKEIVLDIEGELRLSFEEERTLLILPLYGEIIITDFYETISAGMSLTLNTQAGKDIVIKNMVYHDRTDVLIFEFKKEENIQNYTKNVLDFTLKNNAFNISKVLQQPNFIGLYNGRAEGYYALKDADKSIFGMVINGAFEFQNRLMENRDAILLWELEELEFEALSENALILFMEV
ncbi:hypothetical protein WH221_00085 [Chryseobacterium culicis]|uniref:Quercetin 2,3-dioxygenase C-terminal cupin domain-containing protein n=1 Tax=Chryseobacterium culicis TaxID=680127 RepID=A0A2S9CW22_CHRCI|nr:hypothetical protein [Chryseobacterium culicis]PRB84728.1 hypothetical protein CQ022_00085 [Chryseobacterium culicis]PRB87873.1 hypothetical protein CQ033_20790 [Chryseobacterium culicis]